MSAFLAALLAAIGPLLIEALQTLLKGLIDKWKAKVEAAPILAAVDTPDKLHAAMPRLLALVEGDFRGLFGRIRFNRLRSRLEKKAVTDAVWDKMVMDGAVVGELTGVSYVEVLEAVQ